MDSNDKTFYVIAATIGILFPPAIPAVVCASKQYKKEAEEMDAWKADFDSQRKQFYESQLKYLCNFGSKKD